MELIPRQVFFDNPEYESPTISPDGRWLAFLAPDENRVMQIWVRPVDGVQSERTNPEQIGRIQSGQTRPERIQCEQKFTERTGEQVFPEAEVTAPTWPRMVTGGQMTSIRAYWWTYNGSHLVYLRDQGGDEHHHVIAVNVFSRETRDLTPFPGTVCWPVLLRPACPTEILVAINLDDPRRHDLYRINLNTGAMEMVSKNPGTVTHWMADTRFQVQAALATCGDGGADLLIRNTAQDAWEVLRHWTFEDEGYPVGIDDQNRLYVVSNHASNTTRLIAIDLESRQELLLVEDPDYDIFTTLRHPDNNRVQAAVIYSDQREWRICDPDLVPDIEVIRQAGHSEFMIVSRDLLDTIWVIASFSDDHPVSYWLYRRSGMTQTAHPDYNPASTGNSAMNTPCPGCPEQGLTFLSSQRPDMDGLPLSSSTPVRFQARDGLTIHGYLTLPSGVEPRNLPAVVYIHGGPWVRVFRGFAGAYGPYGQWLANRGYAVLFLNFRGSAGYGKAFVNAGNREWGGKMNDDIIDGVRWAVAQGIFDPQRVAVMGDSYGGYATLAALAFTPEVFSAGVDWLGPSNLISFIRSFPPVLTAYLARFQKQVGNVDTEEDFLRSRSPLSAVNDITAPLLIAQGANDMRVNRAESEQMVAALRQAGKTVRYALYPDEGHGLNRPANRLHFLALTEQFLAEHIGGCYEPMGEIPGHSGIVV